MPVPSMCGRSSTAEIELTLLLSVIEWLPGPAALSCSIAQRMVPGEPSSAELLTLKLVAHAVDAASDRHKELPKAIFLACRQTSANISAPEPSGRIRIG